VKVIPVRCLRDNFAYLVVDEDGVSAAVVDPGETVPVMAAVVRHQLTLREVWATHHHADHVGGARGLFEVFPNLTVVAHARDAERVGHFVPVRGPVRVVVEQGDERKLGSLHVEIIHNPGHTQGAISFLVRAPDPEEPAAVFTGDTLFSAGCGRLFEGDAAMMHASLSKLAALPPSTRVYFGHEYTHNNLRFAHAVTPDDAAVVKRIAEVQDLLSVNADTTPSTIHHERAVNPFLRCSESAIIAAARKRGAKDDSPVEVFAALRAWKDSF
jgi:hydroxyacylglutathione hydrolase